MVPLVLVSVATSHCGVPFKDEGACGGLSCGCFGVGGKTCGQAGSLAPASCVGVSSRNAQHPYEEPHIGRRLIWARHEMYFVS